MTNGAQWIVDEVQLCQESVTTLRQLAGFAARFGTAEPFGLTCMSARVPAGLLETADSPRRGTTVGILPDERAGELAVRLGAARAIRRLDAGRGDYEAVAERVRALHRTGTLTLVVLNTVRAARETYRHLRGGPYECTLLHSRFRGIERARLIADVTGRPEDRIVVATQVVEAGMDLSASVLVTEAAPWPAVVQRAGRCNRTGKVTGAEVWWLAPGVAWASWTPGADGAPDPDVKAPPGEYRCRVSLGDVARLAKDRAVWRLDQVAGSWVKITDPGQPRVRPGEVLLVSACDGGYDQEAGLERRTRPGRTRSACSPPAMRQRRSQKAVPGPSQAAAGALSSPGRCASATNWHRSC